MYFDIKNSVHNSNYLFIKKALPIRNLPPSNDQIINSNIFFIKKVKFNSDLSPSTTEDPIQISF